MTDVHERLYDLITELSDRIGGPRTLADLGRADLPTNGVYLFFEPGELTPDGRPRVVRIGTHALRATNRATLWKRLAQHRGSLAGRHPGAGNHRGSIFRRHVGIAFLNSGGWPDALAMSWRQKKVDAAQRLAEIELERAVSAYLRRLPLLWLAVPDPASRVEVEAGLISLLSGDAAGEPSPGWLGRRADAAAIRASGLWNVEHVGRPVDAGMLDRLARCVACQS